MASLKIRLYQSNVTETTTFKALLLRSFIIYKKVPLFRRFKTHHEKIFQTQLPCFRQRIRGSSQTRPLSIFHPV